MEMHLPQGREDRQTEGKDLHNSLYFGWTYRACNQDGNNSRLFNFNGRCAITPGAEQQLDVRCLSCKAVEINSEGMAMCYILSMRGGF